MGIVVFSACDGISIGQLALKELGIEVDLYIASEIKKHAIKVTQEHFPNTLQVGDLTKIRYEDGVLYYEGGQIETVIDLAISGCPCQSFSSAASFTDNRNGLEGKSGLFYNFLELKNQMKPKYFFMENVKMKKTSENELNEFLGVDGIHINSKLVSYQNRYRIYWTDIPNISILEDRNISFQDYKETNYDICKEYKMKPTMTRVRMWNNGEGRVPKFKGDSTVKYCDNVTYTEKVSCITCKQDRSPNAGLVEFDGFARYLTRRELEQGQTLPIDYTSCLNSYRQMQDVVGDGWTLEVIKHLFEGLKEK